MHGGAGNDNLNGGPGCDHVFGGAGDDTLERRTGASATGASAASGCIGGPATTINGGAGRDFMSGGTDDDRRTAAPGADMIFANHGRDPRTAVTATTSSGRSRAWT